MADINQVITLGIGEPADIEHFILLGLNGLSHTEAPECRTYDVPEDDRTYEVDCT